ncbi:MAG TPA: hypothetical protein VKE40_21280 [Gemmataceae bacterium]|nr:hypothetical protein [Gemmataceae bacterium]
MRRLMLAGLLVCGVSGSGCDVRRVDLDSPPTRAQDEELSLRQLPDFERERFDPTHYVYAASTVQDVADVDRAVAFDNLRALARNPENDRRMIVLCRLLFQARPGSQFRRPGLGEPTFIGGTGYADWPMEPIELVDGVPFLIVRGYALAGQAEPGQAYLEYCIDSCDWSGVRLEPKRRAEKAAALDKLKASPKWKQALTKDENDFLSSQLR